MRQGFTLLELIVVIVIIGILATFAMPAFMTTKEHALGNEAQANLRLIRAAERIYRMEQGTYFPATGSVTDIGGSSGINENLKLFLNENNWDYTISGGTDTFTATATRSGPHPTGCVYTLNQSSENPVGNVHCK